MKELWFLLPISTLYLVFYIALEVIPFSARPLDDWWGIPAALTLGFVVLASFIFGIVRGIKGINND